MILKLFRTRITRPVACMMTAVLAWQLLAPLTAHALTSGPVQPEAQGFEPVGTTDMVDPFTGDFVYNIPLMDVEGYPINIAYHGGVGMEQEASWVGLGWSLTPGAVNRAVRGLPDEFDGDTVEKELYIKPDTTIKVGISAGLEPLGVGEPYLKMGGDLGGYLTFNNYRGVSVDLTASAGINLNFGPLQAGVNSGVSVGSQSGAAINYGANVGVGASTSLNNDLQAGGSFNANIGGVYSPRTSLRTSAGIGVSVGVAVDHDASATASTGVTVPIGRQNYTAAITTASYMNSYSGQLKLGGELWDVYANAKISGSLSETAFDSIGHRRGFGYFHLHHGTDSSLMDFSREKDGNWNTTMQLLPQTHLTYDIYSVSGQGTGGSFRPFRNDIGAVYDPTTSSTSKQEDLNIEAGVGNLFEIGGEGKKTTGSNESGPWQQYKRKFTGPQPGTYEDVYFKEAGELTQNNETYLNGVGNTQVLAPDDAINLPLTKPNANTRVTRANHIYTLTGDPSDTAMLLDSRSIVSYEDTTGFKTYPAVTKTIYPRVDAGNPTTGLKRRPNQVTEIVQTQKDGRRYIYGLPVLNNVQREATFAIPHSNVDATTLSSYQVNYTPGTDDKTHNGNGLDNFYSSTVTPTYVSAHLLTGVLSADYVDVTGDGITDDDLGTYTKFNYSRKSNDYRWRSPSVSGKAQYIPGFYTEPRDDKAAYMAGSREEWMLHSVETKNYVAEFYTSKRQDAKGVTDPILSGSHTSVYKDPKYLAAGAAADQYSYKLDSIVLYNKHDRFINGPAAQPVKSVIFSYNYWLCPGVPNSSSGKLTLQKIQVRYGSSNINMSAAYSFGYDTAYNYAYNVAAKDRWGSYKPTTTLYSNSEFPFTTQSAATNDYAKAWSLSQVHLPSGGIIKVDYESDDYAYVQDKEAMEMFHVMGFGNSQLYTPGSQLYFSASQPNLYAYFTRDTSRENKALPFGDNYLKGTSTLYYNVPVELAPGKFEPIKGYATIAGIGKCSDGIHGYVLMQAQPLRGTNATSSPIVYTALNTGRYSLPQVMFPGSDPNGSGMDNIVAGLKNAIGELFKIGENPLQYYMDNSQGKNADLTKAYMRLTSPGLCKKGGGQRVKSIKFYDSWNAMTGGNGAIYGKQYSYTMQREDGKGTISSGVASWEPGIGGDEIPQRLPVNYAIQPGNAFPPNDPVDLYQEMPIGESFYPSPVVGYRQVTSHSINIDSGRSSQSEDINYFYTARDFPIQATQSALTNNSDWHVSFTDLTYDQTAKQGFSLVFNDMHGKPMGNEHWVLKTDTTTKARELVSSQKNEYLTQAGQLSNMVPTYRYRGFAGAIDTVYQKMGVETDITIDSRIRKQESSTWDISANLNGAFFVWVPVIIPLGYGFPFGNIQNFQEATVTKVTQQYGVLSKVISTNQGANTELHNEVFDPQTGNVLVTSVNNEWGDRQYTATYPAYWAYKELGPAYENMNVIDLFHNKVYIDSLGDYAARLVNYNPNYSSQYSLPSNLPVARVAVDEDMPNFKLGDELLVTPVPNTQPVRMWVMGYSSDTSHCQLIMTTREPYNQDAVWKIGNSYAPVTYRVARSGNRNRLGETIQSFTTTDASNVLPALKNDLTNLVSLNATEYDHNLAQVFASNTTSDSLNPFVTGKVGMYRPQKQIVNLKHRDYTASTTRKAGTYNSTAFWKVQQDPFAAYCPDSSNCEGGFHKDTVICYPAGSYPLYPACRTSLDSFSLTYLGGDSLMVTSTAFNQYPNSCNFVFGSWEWDRQLESYDPAWLTWTGFGDTRIAVANANTPTVYQGYPRFTCAPGGNSVVIHDRMLIDLGIYYFQHSGNYLGEWLEVWVNGQEVAFHITYLGNNQFRIKRDGYVFTGTNTPAEFINTYNQYTLECNGTVYYPAGCDTSHNFCAGNSRKSPYRVKHKILLGKVGHLDGTDLENWVDAEEVTKYNTQGAEIENKEEGLGYNAAIYGYNQQLPICVAKNAQHGDVLFESFEDYALLKPVPSMREAYMRLFYSPIAPYLTGTTALGTAYKASTLQATGQPFTITKEDAHTGTYCLKTTGNASIPLNAAGAGMASDYSFKMSGAKKYVASLWLKSTSGSALSATGLNVVMDTTSGTAVSSQQQTVSLVPTTNIIEGWQRYEATFTAPPGYKNFTLNLPAGYYADDIRIYPFDANSKGFVYHPVTRKLMATLDENNFATFYEYDAEGNLIRTKKETDQGILTISENHSTHYKQHP